MVAPETIFFSHDTQIGKDVIIQPNVYFGLKVKIKDRVTLRSFSYLDNVIVSNDSVIGPYARIRDGVVIKENSKISWQLEGATLYLLTHWNSGVRLVCNLFKLSVGGDGKLLPSGIWQCSSKYPKSDLVTFAECAAFEDESDPFSVFNDHLIGANTICSVSDSKFCINP